MSHSFSNRKIMGEMNWGGRGVIINYPGILKIHCEETRPGRPTWMGWVLMLEAPLPPGREIST